MSLKEGWIFKCGGTIKTWKKRWLVIKGNFMYYYAKPNDKVPKGSIELKSGVKVETAKCKKSPNAFCVRTDGRDYIMYPESKSSEDTLQWKDLISSILNPVKAEEPKKEKKEEPKQEKKTEKEIVTPTKEPKEEATKPVEVKQETVKTPRKEENNTVPQNSSIVKRLNFSKDIVPFLRGGADNQMCEFWNLWFNTVNAQLTEDSECDIQFNFSYSANFNKLFWNSG